MAGATALAGGDAPAGFPQARKAADSALFSACNNYVALPPSEAFKIEYWALEEAKLQRMPAEARFSRRIFLIVGGGSGIGRQTALQMAKTGAHLMIADKNLAAAEETAGMVAKASGKESVAAVELDLADRASITSALRKTTAEFGGI